MAARGKFYGSYSMSVAPSESCSAHYASTDSSSCVLQYEPELFPGLIYRMKVPKVVMLIFVSGKVVLTGTSAVRVPCEMSGASKA